MYQIPLLLVGPQENAEQFIQDFISEKGLSTSQIIRTVVEEGKKEISIDQVKYLTSFATRSVTQQRIFIIESFETASREAQNALLKTLEESPANQQFILLAKNKEYVLPTVRSRARLVQLQPQHVELQPEMETALLSLVKNPVLALSDARFQVKKTEDALLLLDQMVLFWRKQLSKTPGAAAETIKKILHVKHLVLIHNVQPQLAIDSIVLSLHRLR